jgi:hypothetical protein
MKSSITFLFLVIVLFACNDGERIVATPQPATAPAGFFPVTDFIKGQIAEIRSEGINPLLITSRNGKTDSSWVKVEAFDSLFAPFLQPEIDSANHTKFFSEKSFLDQTINAFTFTYDPIAPLPDTFQLQRWDVYIDPQKNTVTRIFLVKRSGEQVTQLTWQADKWCKIVTINNGPKGSTVNKDVLIKWDF